MINVSSLKPAGNFSKNTSFIQKVEALQRPFQEITAEEYSTLLKIGADIVTDGVGFFTFGSLFDSVLIMPLRKGTVFDKLP
jgi:hypothetical protein